MNNKILITNENNILEEIEIIDFFELEEFKHEYILYTYNEEIDNELISYVSIINEVDSNEYELEEITNPYEFEKVQEEISKEIENLLE